MRKVLVPIQIKLMGFFIVVLGAAISFYVFYAVDLFEKDKSAYVFESVKLQNDSKASVLKKIVEESHSELNLLINLSHSTNSVKSIFNQNKMLLSFVRLQKGKLAQSVMGQDHFENYQSDWKKLTEQIKTLNPKDKISHHFIKLEKNYYICSKKTKLNTYFTIYNVDMLLDGLNNGLLYRYMLIDSVSKMNLLGESKDKSTSEFLQQQEKIGTTRGTFIQKINNNRYITSYVNITKSLFILSMVEEQKAYEASSVLKRKSIYFGAFIIALTILLVMLFSKVFTNPIAKLFKASQLFAKNDFEHKVVMSSNDELGVLADSFNDMSSSIVNYMGQMKEKHRLESEMQTAKLVQDSFFPNEYYSNDKYSLKAYYNPATECGGDWWGTFEIDNKLVIMMIDATGHGTPAALVTAMTYNALGTIKMMAYENSKLLSSPENMLSIINQALCDIHNDMMATGFVAIIDLGSGQLQYSNASHNPPLIIREGKPDVTKENLVPLMDAIGKRLGESKTEVYESASISLKPQDLFLLYTDGLLEGENLEGKMWGKRNFYKELVANSSKGVETLVDKTIKHAYEFFNTQAQGDDITLVGVQCHINTRETIILQDSINIQNLQNSFPDYDFTYRWDENACCVIYQDSIENALTKWSESDSIRHFIPMKEELDQKQFNFHEIENGSHIFSIRFHLESVSQVIELIQQNIAKLNLEGQFSELSRYLQTIAVELVQNALIETRKQSRSQFVELIFKENNNFYEIEVTDHIGTLDATTIISKLKRVLTDKTYEEKEDGAGLGLHMILAASDKLIFEVEKGRKTKVKSIINKYKRLKEYKSKQSSIHIYEEY